MSKSSEQLVVNDGPYARFTAAGRYVEVGDVYSADELNAGEYLARSAPVGQLTDEQLEAELKRRNSVKNPGAPDNEPAAALNSPMASDKTLEQLDEIRAKQAEDLNLADYRRASDVSAEIKAQTQAETSLTKAEIVTALKDRGDKVDPSKSKDELAAQLATPPV